MPTPFPRTHKKKDFFTFVKVGSYPKMQITIPKSGILTQFTRHTTTHPPTHPDVRRNTQPSCLTWTTHHPQEREKCGERKVPPTHQTPGSGKRERIKGMANNACWWKSEWGRKEKKKHTEPCFHGAASSAEERSLILSPYSLPRGNREKGTRIPRRKKESEFRLFLCYVPAIGAFFFSFPLLAAGQASSLFFFFSLFSFVNP